MKRKYTISINRDLSGVASFYLGALVGSASIAFATRTCVNGDPRPLWGGGLALACYAVGALSLGLKRTNWRFVLLIFLLLPVLAWHTGWALSFSMDYIADDWPLCGTLTGRELEPHGTGGGIVLLWILSVAVAWLGLGAAFCRMTKETSEVKVTMHK